MEEREDVFRGGTFLFLTLSSSFVAPPTEDIPLDILSILTTILVMKGCKTAKRSDALICNVANLNVSYLQAFT